MRRGRDGPYHLRAGARVLLGGPRTIQAFRALGAIDRFELIVLPILLGDGLLLFPPGGSPLPLRLLGQRAFPDGAVELDYEPGS